uniref:Uncharacterized protein n=1 Tax=Peronospora matthiolae TaxID=2874970 RepID=A0AAV1TR77_9STRA
MGEIKVERDSFAVQISSITAQRKRLNRDLADREGNCSQSAEKMAELHAERDQALQSKYSVFTRMDELVASASSNQSPAPALRPKTFFSTSKQAMASCLEVREAEN